VEPVKLTDSITSQAVQSSYCINKSLKYVQVYKYRCADYLPGRFKKVDISLQSRRQRATSSGKAEALVTAHNLRHNHKMEISNQLLRAESGDSSGSGASHAKGRRASDRCRAPQKSRDQATIHARNELEYHDRSNVPFGPPSQISHQSASNLAFPIKLFEILELVEKDGFSRIISWQPHGRCFVIHRPMELETFLARYMPGTNKIRSFQRQASLLASQDSHGNTIRL
jgi:HSF-type DNA-binding